MLARRLRSEFGGTPYEVLFVNDGSSDTSWNVIRELANTDAAVRGLNLRGRPDSWK